MLNVKWSSSLCETKVENEPRKRETNTIANHEITPRTSYLLSKRNKEKCMHDYMIVR